MTAPKQYELNAYVGLLAPGDIVTRQQLEDRGLDPEHMLQVGVMKEISAPEAEAEIVAAQTEGNPPAQPLEATEPAPAASTSGKKGK